MKIIVQTLLMTLPFGVVAQGGEKLLTKEVLIEQELRSPSPSSGVVDVNSPNFIWHAGKEKTVLSEDGGKIRKEANDFLPDVARYY